MGAVVQKSCHICGSPDVGYRRRYCAPCRLSTYKVRRAKEDLKYREAHREDYRRRARVWLEVNRDQNKANCQRRRAREIEADRARDRDRYAREQEKRKATAALYYAKNRAAVLAKLKTPEGRETSRRRQAAKRDAEPTYRAYMAVSRSIRSALRSAKAGRGWESIVGYTLATLTRHLERQFSRGMSWDNYGEWHIDHIRPRSSFDFANRGDDVIIECWALSNLRPLWATENLSKHAKRTHLI